jgi:hypothetical protein
VFPQEIDANGQDRSYSNCRHAFIAAREKQHARMMHDDLIDMMEWAVAEGIDQEDKIAIFWCVL